MTATATATTTETVTVTEAQPSAISTGRADNLNQTSASGQTAAESNNNSPQASLKSTTKVILGTTLASGVLALAAILFLLHRRRKKKQMRAMYEPEPFQLCRGHLIPFRVYPDRFYSLQLAMGIAVGLRTLNYLAARRRAAYHLL